mgnify:CR=1 FL=1
MHIWLLAGNAGSGKTTAGIILHTLLAQSCMTAFAKKVKYCVALQNDFDLELCETQEGKASIVNGKTIRQLLIEYSLQQKQLHTNAIWANYVKEEIMANPTVDWIIHDWRFLAEYETILTIPNAIVHTIRVHNPKVLGAQIPSERELDSFPMNILLNEGTMKSLRDKLVELIDLSASRSNKVDEKIAQ